MSKSSVIIFCFAVCLLAGSIIAFIEFSEPEPAEIYIQESAVTESMTQDDIFSEFIEYKKKLPPQYGEASLVLVGDIMLSRDVATKIKSEGDINYPFLEAIDYLRGADMVFGNLEAPITAGRRIETGDMIFRIDPGMERALSAANFTVLSLANNHTLNFLGRGLEDTFKYLNQAGLKYAGAGSNEEAAYAPVVLESNDLRFAFLAFAQENFVPPSARSGAGPIVAVMDEGKMRLAAAAAKKEADFLIVSMHAGEEYARQPSQAQIDFAHAAIDAGADMVIGHHSHVVQSAEIYNGKYIFYSLGNFIFDQMWSEETRQGLVVKATFNRNGINRMELMPVLIKDYCQPEFLFGDEAENVLKYLDILFDKATVYKWNDQIKNFAEMQINFIAGPAADKNTNTVKIIESDLDRDSVPERLELTDGILTIGEEDYLWQSPAEWWVDDFAIADSTGDGRLKINMSVWKAGSFGAAMPFWQENDPSIKNHFFVFNFIDDKVTPVWQSSNLDAPNCDFEFYDIDKNGRQELVVIEGEYLPDYSCKGKYLAIWKWNEWGFYNDWRGIERVVDLIK